MKLPIVIILAWVLVLFASVDSNADCAATTPAADFKDSQAVFRGTVTNIGFHLFSDMEPVTFEVDQAWKGVDSNQITVYTEPNTGEGYQFKSGEAYVVYAYPNRGVLYTSQCGETSLVKNATAQLNDLSGRIAIPITKRASNGGASVVLITIGTVLLLVAIGYTVTRYMKRAA